MTEYLLVNNVSDREYTFESNEEILEFVCGIFDENEEFTDEQDKLERPVDALSAIGYIVNYCDSFELVEMPTKYQMKDKIITQITFKKFDDGEIIGLFPNEEWDLNGNIASYVHCGQHGGASRELLEDLPTATEEEYRELKNELENAVGYNLEVI